MEYRELNMEEISQELFNHFIRRQQVHQCWRKIDGQWVIQEHPFVDDWKEEDYEYLVSCLKNTVKTGGVVYGAFKAGELKGFASVEGGVFGSKQQYMELTSLHGSADLRGNGAGRALFMRAAAWARSHGAGKLYISGHSAVETQAFYKAMGCVEAEEYNAEHVRQEPFDCQLEYCIR